MLKSLTDVVDSIGVLMTDRLDRDFGVLRSPRPDPARPLGFDMWERLRPATFHILQSPFGAEALMHWVSNRAHSLIQQSVLYQIAIIWVVNASGQIAYALEEAIDPKSFDLPTVVAPFLRMPVLPKTRERLGHPALVDCGPARIGGEKICEPDQDGRFGWQLNNASGRYGYGEDRTKRHLENVKKEFENYGIFNLQIAFS